MIRYEGDGIQYQPITEPVMPPTAQSVGAGWMGSCLPPTRRTWAVALTVAACVLPSTSAQGAVTPPTGWRPTCPDLVVRKVVLTAQRPSYFSPELINANPGNPGGSSIAVGSIPILQYQALAAPFNDTPTPAFTDQIYDARTDIVRGPRGLHASLQQAFAFDRFTAPTTVTVPDLSWAATYPDRIPRKPQTPLAASELVPTLAPFIDLHWRPTYPDQHLRRRPLFQHVWAQPHFVVEVDVPVMSWTGWYLDLPVRLKARQQPSGPSGPLDPSLLTQPTLPPAASWAAQYPDEVRGRRRVTFSGPSNPPLFIPDQTNPVTVLSWQGRYADRVPAARRLFAGAQPAFSFDRFTAPTPVVAPSLSAPVYPARVYPKAKAPWAPDLTAPSFVPDVTHAVRPLSWTARYPDRVFPRPALRVALQLALFLDAQIAPPVIPITPSRHRTGIPRRQRLAAVRGHARVTKVPRRKRGE